MLIFLSWLPGVSYWFASYLVFQTPHDSIPVYSFQRVSLVMYSITFLSSQVFSFNDVKYSFERFLWENVVSNWTKISIKKIFVFFLLLNAGHSRLKSIRLSFLQHSYFILIQGVITALFYTISCVPLSVIFMYS